MRLQLVCSQDTSIVGRWVGASGLVLASRSTAWAIALTPAINLSCVSVLNKLSALLFGPGVSVSLRLRPYLPPEHRLTSANTVSEKKL